MAGKVSSGELRPISGPPTRTSGGEKGKYRNFVRNYCGLIVNSWQPEIK
jgi:hypothetical protein